MLSQLKGDVMITKGGLKVRGVCQASEDIQISYIAIIGGVIQLAF